jgi:putative zinc finger/helix-turn-helix YgiT family protein
MCETQRAFRRETRREEYEVRDERIALDVPRLICATCGEAEVDDGFGDPTLAVYREYRRRHGLLSPDEIRTIREKYDLSQVSFATLLGTSPATLARYEGGSLQDKAYDQLLRACENPDYVADLVRREGHRLSDRQRRDVEAVLRRLRPSTALASFPDCRLLKWAVYAAVVVWFCRRLQAIPQTKMCKLLFYSDFLAYQKSGHSLTGATYKALPYGPVPCEYEVLRCLLEEQDLVEVREAIYPNGYAGLEFRAGPAAAQVEGELGPDELAVLEFVANTFGRMTAKEISERSHQESAWLQTPSKAIISYDHATRLSVRIP